MPFQFMFFLFFLILKLCKTICALIRGDNFDWIVIITIIVNINIMIFTVITHIGGRCR